MRRTSGEWIVAMCVVAGCASGCAIVVEVSPCTIGNGGAGTTVSQMSSPVLQASPSGQLSSFWQPVPGSHESSVQVTRSSQSTAAPVMQAPPLQMSGAVQRSPSSQGEVLSMY